MLRSVLAILILGGMGALGQAQNDTSDEPQKVDRALAYYHYTLARKYANLAAASGGRNREYVDKAIENYKAALKADPQAPVTADELAGLYVRIVPIPGFHPVPPTHN
jgi:hypothetical protein